MGKFSRLFKDCYGIDNFSRYLFIVGAIFLLNRWSLIPGILLLVYAAFRGISKNKYKRYQELQWFNRGLEIIRQKFYTIKYKFNEHKKYKIFKCPKCSQKMRVPRKKGHITITCRSCGTEFKGKS